MKMSSPALVLGALVALGITPEGLQAAGKAQDAAVARSLQHFAANRQAYGLGDVASELQVRQQRTDARGTTHVRLDQYYKGVKVFEGEAISHVDARGRVTVTSALRSDLSVDVTAKVEQAEAVQTALASIDARGRLDVRRAALEILPRGERSDVDRLVWHVQVGLENGLDEPGQFDLFVDALTGGVVWSFDSLETAASTGTGNTMYAGSQAITTDSASGTFYLRDPLRGGGNYTCDQNNKQAGTCATFSRASNVFGNGVKDSSDRATAGADAHFGLQATWDYYKNTFGRNGIDGAGRRTYSRVHYGRNYQNAFWSNSCFCMTYGDGGSTFYPLVSLDVAGHEMSHGVMSTEANLTYSGESGGLNESNSDIFGTLVEYAVNSSQDLPDYWIGERIYRSNWGSNGSYTQTKALRYMNDPAKDGASPACWSSGLGSLDVHYSSGPNNHMFYLLSNGGTSKCNGQTVSGIGRAAAAAIWYDAITNRMTSSTNYKGARTAALAAAAALYGNGSAQYNAVAAAYSAINVN